MVTKEESKKGLTGKGVVMEEASKKDRQEKERPALQHAPKRLGHWREHLRGQVHGMCVVAHV